MGWMRVQPLINAKRPHVRKGRETVVPPSFADLWSIRCGFNRRRLRKISLPIRNVDYPAGILTKGFAALAFRPALRGPFGASSSAGSHQPPAF